jgi:DNA-binding transcriptional MerR regulator
MTTHTTPPTIQATALLDIGEVARRTGVAPSALRYYERLDLVAPAGRNGLRRTYDPDVIDRIALILNARATGFTLGELLELLHADPATVRAELVEKMHAIDEQIAIMEQARDRLGHALTCEHASLLKCPTFRAGLRELLPVEP